MKKFYLFLISLFLLVFIGCKNKIETKTYILENVEFVSEGPLFEGANSAQYEVLVDATKLFANDKTSDNIKEAKLISCQLVASDSSDFSNVSGFVLQLTAENAEMTEFGLLNQVNVGKMVQLNPSEKDAAKFFKQNKFILLMDTYLKKDQEQNLKFKATIVFEVKIN
jgi:hypothetical protein